MRISMDLSVKYIAAAWIQDLSETLTKEGVLL